ncbi:hydantoinase/oxoprolinase family protein [Halomarina halobia]|uniref:Hydantoinase/oxoprolinase family protein n=1 Tax=Halomarina halobia TaxID=3033386 RepID=A0ABD6AF35_9EURY|nr:hydantoinase/oxoprolinase family protein [Halomarina sp. PSR21]
MIEAKIGVDVGGTFTDVTLVVEGDLITAKVPTTTDQSKGVMDGVEKACRKANTEPADIGEFTHAMTVSTNALLEGNGAKTALVTTAGFRDVLEIGRQSRPDLYDLDAEKPTPLVPRRRRFELAERTTTDGVERSIDQSELNELAVDLGDSDIESLAISFLHAYASPENEQTAVEMLRKRLDIPVSASHEVLAEFREYERTSTTVIDAYVTPAIDAYLSQLERRATAVGMPQPRIMQSNGGIADAKTVRQHAVTTALSGPAAGVVGANRTASSVTNTYDLEGLVTFDMGGTSSDVSLIRDGCIERTTDTSIGGHPIRVPVVDINTVGSGGGSIAWVDAGGALRVGPDSAGAEPGPASYGKGGEEPTVTDANVVLGYIGESTSLGGELSLDKAAADAALVNLAAEADIDTALDAAAGVYQVANAKMTRAIRAVTVERGFDPRNFGLVAFGGAGPLHAAALAEQLDITTIVVPLPSGVLSAYGLLAADEKYDSVRTYRSPLSEVDPVDVDRVYETLVEDTLTEVDVADRATATVERVADLRYHGQSFELQVRVDDSFDAKTIRDRFHAAHERAYGYHLDEEIYLVNLRTTATVERQTPPTTFSADEQTIETAREAYFEGECYETPVYDRETLPVGSEIVGPAILEQSESTTVLKPGWIGTVQPDGTLVMEVNGDE